jgi:hypothetical protein
LHLYYNLISGSATWEPLEQLLKESCVPLVGEPLDIFKDEGIRLQTPDSLDNLSLSIGAAIDMLPEIHHGTQ